MKDVFRSGDSSKTFKIAACQCYRYASSYVSTAYPLLEGFQFIQEPPSGDLQERVLIRHMIMNSVSSPFSCCSGIVSFFFLKDPAPPGIPLLPQPGPLHI